MIIAPLKMAPATAQIKKILEGENRSEMVKKAKINVPIIKPNCTKDVR